MKTLKYILALVCLLCAMPAFGQSTLDGRRVTFPIPIARLGTAGTQYTNGSGWSGGAVSAGEDIGYNGAAYGFMYRNNLPPAIVASTSNVSSLSGTTTIDGQAVSAGQVVLLTGQTTASQNGPWVVESGAWVRPFAYTSGIAMPAGLVCWVYAGSSNGPALWYLSGTTAATVDTTSTSWTWFAVSGTGTMTSISGPTGITWTNPTTTPAGAWSNESAYAFLYNDSGSAGVPTFQALVNAALPSNIFASSQAPASVAASSETWSSSTEFIQWYASQTSGPANGAAEYYGWELSTNGGSTWGTEVFGGPTFTDPTGITSGTEEARARAYCLTVNGTSPTASSWVTSSAQSYATSPYGGGGGSSDQTYISGLYAVYSNSGTWGKVTIEPGTCWVPSGSGQMVSISSAVSWQPGSAPTASSWYYLALSSAGALSESTTAPTQYASGPWEDASGDRIVGVALTDSSSNIYAFAQDQPNHYAWQVNFTAAPGQILSAGTATTPTNVSCTGIIPKNATGIDLGLVLTAPGGTGNASIGNQVVNTGLLTILSSGATGIRETGYVPLLSSTQSITYSVNSGSQQLSIYGRGFTFLR